MDKILSLYQDQDTSLAFIIDINIVSWVWGNTEKAYFDVNISIYKSLPVWSKYPILYNGHGTAASEKSGKLFLFKPISTAFQLYEFTRG